MKIITEWTLDDLVALAHQELARQGFGPEEGESAVIRFEDRQIANADLVVKLAIVKAQLVITTAPDEAIAPPKVKDERKRQAMNPERIAKMNAARAAKRQEREAAQAAAGNDATTNGHKVEVGPIAETIEVVAAPVSPF
jgi:hypothetical protein